MKTLGRDALSSTRPPRCSDSTLGRYTEVGAGCHVVALDAGRLFLLRREHPDRLCRDRQVRQHRRHVRIYASMHPMERASLHHFTYRSAWYFEGEPRTTRTSSTGAPSNAHHHRPRHLDRPWRGDHARRDDRQWRHHRLQCRGHQGCRRFRHRRRRAGADRSASVSRCTSPTGSMRWPGGTGSHERLHAGTAGFPHAGDRGVSGEV